LAKIKIWWAGFGFGGVNYYTGQVFAWKR
jgi:hypothetical protein